jgi:hypothetical protein
MRPVGEDPRGGHTAEHTSNANVLVFRMNPPAVAAEISADAAAFALPVLDGSD